MEKEVSRRSSRNVGIVGQKSSVTAITYARKYDNYLFDTLLECMKIEVEKHIGMEMIFQEIGRDRESGSLVFWSGEILPFAAVKGLADDFCFFRVFVSKAASVERRAGNRPRFFRHVLHVEIRRNSHSLKEITTFILMQASR